MTTELTPAVTEGGKFAKYLTRQNIIYGSVALLVLTLFICYMVERSRARHRLKAIKVILAQMADMVEQSQPVPEGDEGLPINSLAPEKRADLGARINVLYGYDALVPGMPVIRGGLDFNIRPMPSMNNRAVWFQAWTSDRKRYVDVVRDPFKIFGANRHKVADFDAYHLQVFEATESIPFKTIYVRAEGDPKADGDQLRKAIIELLKTGDTAAIA